MTDTPFKKGDNVLYNTAIGTVRARVERVHRDGSFTVRALFYSHDGRDVPGYLGYTYSHVRPLGMRAA